MLFNQFAFCFVFSRREQVKFVGNRHAVDDYRTRVKPLLSACRRWTAGARNSQTNGVVLYVCVRRCVCVWSWERYFCRSYRMPRAAEKARCVFGDRLATYRCQRRLECARETTTIITTNEAKENISTQCTHVAVKLIFIRLRWITMRSLCGDHFTPSACHSDSHAPHSKALVRGEIRLRLHNIDGMKPAKTGESMWRASFSMFSANPGRL